MQNKTLMKLGLGAILSVALIAGYYGCGGGSSSSSDSGSSGQDLITGVTDTGFGTLGVASSTINASSNINSLALQTDGKILAGGTSSNKFALARYTITGTLDAAFGAGGVVSHTIGSVNELRSIAIQTDGNIVAGGFAWNGSNYDFTLARYTASGALDTGFGSGDGVITSTIDNESLIYDIVLQADGKIVAGGYSDASIPTFAVARYTTAGALDTTFGSGDGVVTTTIGLNSSILGIGLQADGKIVAGGYYYDGFDYYVALARYTISGTLDTAFGDNGVVTTTVGSGGSIDDEIYALAIQPDGKIVASGYSMSGSDYYALVVRYTASGALDTTFSGDGVVTMTFPSYTDIESNGIALQSNGKILITGYAYDGSSKFMLARFNANGAIDTGFGNNGMAVQLLGTGGSARDVLVQPDGYIVVAGSATYSGQTHNTLMRFK